MELAHIGSMKRVALRLIIISAGLVVAWPQNACAADTSGDYQSMSAVTSEATYTSGWHGMIGTGVFNGESILADSRNRTALRPLLFLRYEDWAYLSLRGGGLWLLHSADRSLRLGIGVSVHSAYNPFHEANLAGRDRRRSSIDADVNASWRTPIVDMGLSYAHDIGNASNGDTASLRVSRGFPVTPRLRVTPGVAVRWESAKVVDYYYGVRPDEVIPGRPAYKGRETTNIVAGLSADYRLTQAWSLLGDVRTTFYGPGITDSPVVERKESTFVLLGAGLHF